MIPHIYRFTRLKCALKEDRELRMHGRAVGFPGRCAYATLE
jgi:hypothetical protein